VPRLTQPTFVQPFSFSRELAALAAALRLTPSAACPRAQLPVSEPTGEVASVQRSRRAQVTRAESNSDFASDHAARFRFGFGARLRRWLPRSG
jgi:hypothetical protein